jgi:hypothetical protein
MPAPLAQVGSTCRESPCDRSDRGARARGTPALHADGARQFDRSLIVNLPEFAEVVVAGMIFGFAETSDYVVDLRALDYDWQP